MPEHKGLEGHEEHKGVWLGGKRGKAKAVTEPCKALALTSPCPLGAGGEGEVLWQGAGGCQVLRVSSWRC